MGDTLLIICFFCLYMYQLATWPILIYSLHLCQVLPSLDVSFDLSPYPSRLQEFLLRMDVVNKTSSEYFQVHQLSSVGQQWDISLLQPVDSILPSQSLFAGQALTCFFMLKVGTTIQELAPWIIDLVKYFLCTFLVEA